jgi:dynein heavy chain
MTLGQFKYLQLHRYIDELTEISERAKREARLEQMLAKMELDWASQFLELTTLRDTAIPILLGPNVEAMQQRLDEHCLLAQTVRSSPDVGPLQERAEVWARTLTRVQEVLEVWLRVQANFLYLEPVLRADDIRTTLPTEAREFELTAEAWTTITGRVQPGVPIIEITGGSDLLGLLREADLRLERILRSLHSYLETKRECFPRFYFLSNEELLEILGESRKPERVQPHLKKCFEGTDRLVFEPGQKGAAITGLLSKEGELVEILKEVVPGEFQNNVERWLLELESQMEQSVQDLVHRCLVEYSRAKTELALREKWLLEWQGQAILVSCQQAWTERAEQALLASNSARSLNSFLEESQRNLAQIVGLVRE